MGPALCINCLGCRCGCFCPAIVSTQPLVHLDGSVAPSSVVKEAGYSIAMVVMCIPAPMKGLLNSSQPLGLKRISATGQ
jgi:hypothetical protein